MDTEALAGGPNIRRTLVVAALAVGLFFGGLGGWSMLAALESAAIASGEVGAIGKQKVIEHLEGGIVRDILVKDGDQVEAGQVLLRLDEVQPRAYLSLITSRYYALLALQARLVAERGGSEQVRFPDELLTLDDENVSDILLGQRNIFTARKQALDTNREIYAQRIAQYSAEIEGLKHAIKAQNRELDLLEQEVAAYQTLEDRGMSAGKIRMMAAQRNYARVQAERSKNQAQVARASQSVAEMQVRINSLATDQLNEVVEQLRETENQLFEVHERYRAASDVLSRTEVRAPISGTVVGLQVHTVGGVIDPGEAILGLVPRDEQLVIDARLDPADIDVVRPGLAAHVRFTAFSSRSHQPVAARVLTVSADRFNDERTGEVYFKVQVALTGDLGAALKGESLYPGMQAEVMIVTGSQTPMEYLLDPLTTSLGRAFREQ